MTTNRAHVVLWTDQTAAYLDAIKAAVWRGGVGAEEGLDVVEGFERGGITRSIPRRRNLDEDQSDALVGLTVLGTGGEETCRGLGHSLGIHE